MEPQRVEAGRPLVDREPTPFQRASRSLDTRTVRAWALENEIAVSRTGGIPRFVYELYRAAHPDLVAGR